MKTLKQAFKEGLTLDIITINNEIWQKVYQEEAKTQKQKNIGSYFSIYTNQKDVLSVKSALDKGNLRTNKENTCNSTNEKKDFKNSISKENFKEENKKFKMTPPPHLKNENPEPLETLRVCGGVISHYGEAEVPNDSSNDPCVLKTFGTSLVEQRKHELMASFSNLFAPDDPNSRVGDCPENPFKIALDSEFMYYKDEKGNDKERGVLSYQGSFIWNDVEFCCIYKYLEPRTDFRIALTTFVGYILNFIKLISSEADYFPVYSYYELNKQKKEDKKFKQDIFDVCIICHAGIADLSSFYRGHKTQVNTLKLYENPGILKDKDSSKAPVFNPLRYTSSIQGGLISLRNAFTDINLGSNYTMACSISFRDTMALAPAGSKSLKTLGELIGIPKVEIRKEDIENMDQFYIKDPKAFTEYAMQDSYVTLKYANSLYSKGIPVTNSSAGATLFKAEWCKLKGLDIKDKESFNAEFRGLKKQKSGKSFYVADGGVKVKDIESLEPLSSDIFDLIDLAGKAYCGGLNACFTHGWEDDYTYDYDLQGAYPTAISTQPDIDYTKLPAVDIRAPFDPTIFAMYPFIPYFAYVDFEFPEDTKFPCIPLRHEGSLIFPLKGEDVPACGPDLLAAYYMGAKIYVKKGIRPQIKLPFKSTCSEVFKILLGRRSQAKELFGKKSVQQSTFKEITNSVYGKMAQGVLPKTSYNPLTKSNEDIGISAITNPCISAMGTSIVRATLSLAMFQLDQLGYKSFSVTTDGFISNAPEEVIKSLELFGFAPIISKARTILVGSPDIWEVKHEQQAFLNFCTRGNVAPTLGGVCAHNSYKTGLPDDSLEDRQALIEAVLTRTAPIPSDFIDWTSLQELYEKEKDFSPTIVSRRLRMDYDFKRKPINAEDKRLEVYGKAYDYVHFDTKPFDTLEEYICTKQAYLSMLVVKSSADVADLYSRAENKVLTGSARAEVYLTSDSSRAKAISVLRGYRSGQYNIPAFDDKTGVDITLFLTDYLKLDKPLTSADWKNAIKKGRSKTLAPDTMLDLVEALEVLTVDEFSEGVTKAKDYITEQNISLIKAFYKALVEDYIEGLEAKKFFGYIPTKLIKSQWANLPRVAEVEKEAQEGKIYTKSRIRELYKKTYQSMTKALREIDFKPFIEKEKEIGYIYNDKVKDEILTTLRASYKALIEKERTN